LAKISLNVPDDLVEHLGESPEAASREILLAAAFYWCRRGDLSTSQAARLGGVTYAGFLEAAVERQAVLYDYDTIEAEIPGALPQE
jgi:hypothetical protein